MRNSFISKSNFYDITIINEKIFLMNKKKFRVKEKIKCIIILAKFFLKMTTTTSK